MEMQTITGRGMSSKTVTIQLPTGQEFLEGRAALAWRRLAKRLRYEREYPRRSGLVNVQSLIPYLVSKGQRVDLNGTILSIHDVVARHLHDLFVLDPKIGHLLPQQAYWMNLIIRNQRLIFGNPHESGYFLLLERDEVSPDLWEGENAFIAPGSNKGFYLLHNGERLYLPETKETLYFVKNRVIVL